MPQEPRTVLIVTLASTADVQATKERISEIEGVSDVDFNYLTQKIRVRYFGDGEKGPAIHAAILKVIGHR
jgi:hypothetical protein